MNYKHGYPIIIGLSGKAGTGKTVSALSMVPEKKEIPIIDWDDDDDFGEESLEDLFHWDHKFLAMPLYDLANIRRDNSGLNAKERMKYEVHDVLFDLFGRNPRYGLPDYDVLVDLVYEIIEMPIEMDRQKKPRSFLQNVGTLCREVDPDCFINWMIRSIKRDAAVATENKLQYVCVVSDIRMPNEAEGIIRQNNGMVIKLTASEDVRLARLMNRDGRLMTKEQAEHVSEQVDSIPNEHISCTLNTDGMTIREQAVSVVQAARELLDIELPNPVPAEKKKRQRVANA